MATKQDFLKVTSDLHSYLELPSTLHLKQIFEKKEFFLDSVLSSHNYDEIVSNSLDPNVQVNLVTGKYEYRISSSGIYYFVCSDVEPCISSLKIHIDKNLDVTVIFVFDNPKSFVESILELSEHSSCSVLTHVYATRYFKTKALLESFSNYTLESSYLTSQQLFLDHSTYQNAPSSFSDIKSKGIVFNGGNVINDGMVFIGKEGSECSGHQLLKNILLDSKSRVSSLPGLNVSNFNVSCSHGASTSTFSKEELFFLMSRGLSYQESLLLYLEHFFLHSIDHLEYFKEEILDFFQKNISLTSVLNNKNI
jgi:hypothetical protein